MKASRAGTPLTPASSFACRSRVTSHDLPQMESLLAGYHTFGKKTRKKRKMENLKARKQKSLSEIIVLAKISPYAISEIRLEIGV